MMKRYLMPLIGLLLCYQTSGLAAETVDYKCALEVTQSFGSGESEQEAKGTASFELKFRTLLYPVDLESEDLYKVQEFRPKDFKLENETGSSLGKDFGISVMEKKKGTFLVFATYQAIETKEITSFGGSPETGAEYEDVVVGGQIGGEVANFPKKMGLSVIGGSISAANEANAPLEISVDCEKK